MSTAFITINSVRLQAVDGNNVVISVCVCLCILLYSLFPVCCCSCSLLLLLFAEQCQRFDVLTICHAKLGSSSRRRGVKINAQQLITPPPPHPTPPTLHLNLRLAA